MTDKTPNAAFCMRAPSAPPDAPARTLYFFKEQQYICWDIETESLIAGYPRDIRQDWPGLLEVFPGQRITGALYVPEWGEKVYFFFSDRSRAAVWDLASEQLESETLEISKLLPSTVSVDGNFAPVYAQTSSGGRVVYGFRGHDYTRWTVTPGAFPAAQDAGFPHKIAPDWKDGLVLAPKCGVHAHWPNRSSAHSNNKIYFFMGDLYLRWDVPSNTRNYRTDIFAGWKQWPQFA